MGFRYVGKNSGGNYQYSYDPQNQTYTQISGSETSAGSPIKRLMGELMGSLGKSDQYQYSYNPEDQSYTQTGGPGMKKGGKVKMSTASKRADGVAQRGKTKGRMV
jgi:hypothetical protein